MKTSILVVLLVTSAALTLFATQTLTISGSTCSVPDALIHTSWKNASGTCIWTVGKAVFNGLSCSADMRCMTFQNPDLSQSTTCATPQISVPDTCNQMSDHSTPPEFTTTDSSITPACDPGGAPICPNQLVWDSTKCMCVNPRVSPILVDLEGTGFHLTSLGDGVMFDLDATGTPQHVSWTAANVRNGFLALDRNGNGKIDDGKELFGDVTAQPPSAQPNGFIALAEFDKAENGGNGDGIIDENDAVYSRLLIWTDINHDGVSQPNELTSLKASGIVSIDLQYQLSGRKDGFGNLFRYKARVNAKQPVGDIGPWAFDVFFLRGASN